MVKLDCAVKVLEKQYYKLGKLIGRKPLPFLVIPVLVTLFSLTGFYWFNIEYDLEYYYTPINGEAKQERAKFKAMFPENHSSNFIASRRNEQDGFVQVVLYDDSSENNIWTKNHFETILQIDKEIREITCEHSGLNISYSDICAMWDGTCSTNLLLQILNNTADNILTVPVKYPIHDEHYFIGSSLANVTVQNNSIIMKAKAVMLNYYVKYIDPTDITASNKWLSVVKEHLLTSKSRNGLRIVFQTSLSIGELIKEVTTDLLPLFSIGYALLLLFSVLSCLMLDCVRSKPWVAVAGEVSAGMAVGTAMGFLLACQVSFSETVTMMPFLVIGIGIDDTFVLLSAWRQSSCLSNVEERMGETLKNAAVSITITSLTDALAFAAGCLSPFRSVVFFGIYTVVGIILSYVYALTFLSACMVYSGRREEENKHVFTFRKATPKYKSENRSFLYRLCCTGGTDDDEKITPDELQQNSLPLATKIFGDIYTPFIMKTPLKVAIVLLYALYLSFAIWGCIFLTEGIKIQDLVPSGSYIIDLMNILNEYFYPNYGPRIMVAFTDSLNYSDSTVRDSVISAIQVFQQSDKFSSASSMTESWVAAFDEYIKSTNQTVDTMHEFISVLTTNFLQLKEYNYFDTDIVFNTERSEIIQSRFLIQSLGVTSTVDEKNLMLEARRIAEDLPFKITVYHPNFIFYDQYTVIVSTTIQTIGIALISIFLVSIVLLPNVLTVITVVVSVASILVGVVGYMVLWGVPLNSVTSMSLAMSTGFAVDFTAHICYHFVSCTDKDPSEKTREALVYLGHPITQAAVSTILGVSVLASSDTAMIVYFFRLVFLVMSIGFLHGVVFLPVFLTLAGIINKKRKKEVPTVKSNIKGINNNVREGWI